MAASSLRYFLRGNASKICYSSQLPFGFTPVSRTSSSTATPRITAPDARENSTLSAQFKKATGISSNRRPLFWTSESDPANHLSRHEGFFYTVPAEHFSRWMRLGLCEHFYKCVAAFQESCIMVRKPAVEVIQCMKASDLALPVVRYVLFGRPGCGKSTSLAHVMHFCGTQGWLVAHVNWAAAYNRYYKDVQPSTFVPGRVDMPVDAAEWLANFRKTNEPLLKSLALTTANQYTWSKRDVTEIGTPLLDVIEFALSRTKYACDVMGVVLKELRLRASKGDVKLLVAIDGVNAFWSTTPIKQESNRHVKHPASDLAIVQHWRRMLANDWSGGAVVCTVDGNATQPADPYRYLPLDLLEKEGFETLDPYIPIHVVNYSDKEVYSCIEYFVDRKWIQNAHAQTEDGMKELQALTSGNPLKMYEVTINW